MRHARGERGMIGLAAAVASVVIVAVIGGALLVHAYSDTVRNLTRKDSIGYLADISSQITENVRTVTSQIFSAMETIERGQMTLVENGATLDELNGEMAEDRDRWNLSRLAYVDEDGVWYFADTTQRYTRSQDYLNKTLLEGKRSISGIETMDGQDVLVFSIPVNAVIDGHHMKALAGVYGVDEMLQLLSIDSFEGRGYACIVKDDGSVAVRPEDQTAISGEYNIVSALESQNADDEEPVHVLRAGLKKGEQGVVLAKYNGVSSYFCYTPVGVSDWHLLSIVPSDYVDQRTNSLYLLTVAVDVTVTLVFGVIMLFIVIVQHRNRRRLEAIAYVDPVTGGDTAGRFRERYYDVVRTDPRNLVLVYANIAKFKSYNDREGKEGGDRLLRSAYDMIERQLREGEFAARVSADHFVILLREPDEASTKERLNEFRLTSESVGEQVLVSMDFGAYILDDDALEQEFTLVTDAANLARASAEKRMLIRAGVIIIHASLDSVFSSEPRPFFIVLFQAAHALASMMIASVGASFERRSSRIAFPMRLRTASFICICSRRLRCPSAASSVLRRSCAGSLRKVCSARTSSFRSSSATALSPSWISTCFARCALC